VLISADRPEKLSNLWIILVIPAGNKNTPLTIQLQQVNQLNIIDFINGVVARTTSRQHPELSVWFHGFDHRGVNTNDPDLRIMLFQTGNLRGLFFISTYSEGASNLITKISRDCFPIMFSADNITLSLHMGTECTI